MVNFGNVEIVSLFGRYGYGKYDRFSMYDWYHDALATEAVTCQRALFATANLVVLKPLWAA